MTLALDSPVGQTGPVARSRAVAEERAPQLPALTGLRFAAALLVVAKHIANWHADLLPLSHGTGVLAALAHGLSNVVTCGYVGVNIFFLLSGFILAYSYLDQGGRVRGGVRAFWVARVARIYPVYLLAFALAAVPFVWDSPPHVTAVQAGLAGVTLTQSWFPFVSTAWDAPSWSLSVEAFFYLMFPIIGPRIAQLGRVRLLVFIVLLWALTLVAPSLYLIAHPDGTATWPDAYWFHVILYNPIVRLPEFLMGIALGRLYVMRQRTMRGPRGIRLVALGAMGASGMALALSGGIPWPLIHDGLFDPLLALLIYGLAWGRGVLAWVCRRPTVVLLGEASYSLYILHYPLWEWLTHGAPAAASGSPIFCLSYVCLGVAISILSLRLIEQPARRAIRRVVTIRPIVNQ